MNPYLEQDDAWHDFRKRFIPAAAEAIGPQAGPDHIVKIAVGHGHESFVEIGDRRSRELVCIVELLSPSNKRPGPDREQYLAKRRQILASAAHLVEVDLLRGGEAMPSDDQPPCDYSVTVSRVEDRPVAGFWSIGLRDALPEIPIPLRPPHPEVRLDLQALLHRVYDAARYGFYIYEGGPSPALPPDDLDWARRLIPSPA